MSDAAELDREWLLAAIEVSWRCPPTSTAYNAGAIIVNGDGRELARGYSRDTDPHVHAEESALAKLTGLTGLTGLAELAELAATDLTAATIYTSLEPCSTRKHRPHTCTELIIAAGLRRVVFALHEPPIFVDCQGAELLQRAGLDVVEVGELADLVRQVNRNVIRDAG